MDENNHYLPNYLFSKVQKNRLVSLNEMTSEVLTQENKKHPRKSCIVLLIAGENSSRGDIFLYFVGKMESSVKLMSSEAQGIQENAVHISDQRSDAKELWKTMTQLVAVCDEK